MTQGILVTYATRTGSTAGVAEFIGKTLGEAGRPVGVWPMADVIDLAQYDAVVAGSAIQGKQWLPEALDFMRKNQVILRRMPCAVFQVCMTLAMSNGEKYFDEVASFFNPVRVLVTPVSEGMFAGVLDISKVPKFRDRLGFRLSVLFGVWSEGDHRDWDAIRAWADSLPPLLVANKT
jgi:menaquinone-dependent protoporphyrinogen oxidase